MTRRPLFAATVLAAIAIGGAAFADSDHGHKGQPGSTDRAGMTMHGGAAGMMGMMQRMHGTMTGGGMDGSKMGGMSPMGGAMMQMFDADGDGTVTPEELRTQLQARLAEYDSNGDGSLSIAEFEQLHSAMIREMMVDRFQYLDADGDGSVTPEEMAAPADRMKRMQKMRASQGQMRGQPGNGQGMGDGSRMKDN